MREYKKLEVWKMALELSTEVYKTTLNFPKFEQYGITSQIQRSAVSVPSNIAEGAGRGTEKQFSQYLHIAYGSLCELETQLLIAQNLKYFTRDSQKAQDLLTQYQENRYQSRVSAYTGTAGILLAIIALPLGRWISPSNPTTIQSAALLLGTAIAIEGYSYSIMLLRENESLIPRATQEYNHDRPKDPVELQFSTGWSF